MFPRSWPWLTGVSLALLIAVSMFYGTSAQDMVETEVGSEFMTTTSHLNSLSTTSNSLVIRKSARFLSYLERQEYVARVLALKSLPDPTFGNVYNKYVQIHEDYFIAPNIHGHPSFLPWHRQFIWMFERELQNVNISGVGPNPNFGLPYWDWELDVPTWQNNPVWFPDFMGGNGPDFPAALGPVLTGPFTFPNWTTDIGRPLRRQFGQAVANLPTVADLQLLMNYSTYDSPRYNHESVGFRSILEGFHVVSGFSNPADAQLHTRAHEWVGGEMEADSPNDPLFWLHYSTIDRIWAYWQQKYPAELNSKTTTYPAAGAGSYQNLADVMLPSAWNVRPMDVLNYPAMNYGYQNPYLWQAPRVFHPLSSAAVQSNAPPGLQVFKDQLFIAVTIPTVSKGICVAYSSDGVNFSNCSWAMTDKDFDRQPTFAVYNNRLYLAITAAWHSGICIISSPDGISWSNSSSACTWTGVDIQTENTPSFTVFQGRLYLSYAGTYNAFCVSNSNDGITWTGCQWVQGQVNWAWPEIYGSNQYLYLAFKGRQGQMTLVQSADGVNWEANQEIFSTPVVGATPALTFLNNNLCMAFGSTTFQLNYACRNYRPTNNFAPFTYTPVYPIIPLFADQQLIPGSSQPPALVAFQNKLCLAWQGQDLLIYSSCTSFV